MDAVGAAVAVIGRRAFLGLLGAAAAGAAVAGCGPAFGSQTGVQLVSGAPLPPRFRTPLPVPPVARPGPDDRYVLTQRPAQLAILPGLPTPALTYEGSFPGPTIEARSGRAIDVLVRNELAVPTVQHLHGGHVAAADDGWPLDLLLPAGSAPGAWAHHGMVGDAVVGERTHHYPMAQRAAQLWYHDHRMDFTGPAVYRGLAGLVHVRDDVEDALPLPRGERELPLMICDRSFRPDGSFDYPGLDQGMRTLPGVEDAWTSGVLGDVVLVNGAAWPVHEVDAARYRLRLLNASNARRYRLAFSTPALQFVQIGSDGGLLAAPVGHPYVDIAPGERFDVVVDFAAVPVGSTVVLANAFGTGSTADVMAFRVVRAARDDSVVPARLGEVEPLVPPPGARVRQFSLLRGAAMDRHDGWTINGAPFDPDVPVADVPLGETEVWRFVTDVHHPVHVHLDAFQVLRRGAGGPGRFDGGRKDTVDMVPAQTVEVAVRFTDHRGRFVFHCHNLEHEDMAMMAAIRTV